MNTQSTSNPSPPVSNDEEIDLLEFTKVVWNGRKTILKCILFAGGLGILIAFLSPKEYTSSTTMVPQTSKSSGNLGGLSSLAAIAGFDIDPTKSGDALSPLVYPQIISSGPFQLELMNTPFTFSEVNHPISLYEYYNEIARPSMLSLISKYTIGLPGVIISAIKRDSENKITSEEKGPIYFSKKQEKVRKMMEERISLEVDSKQGYLTLQASFHEALLSAQVADQARELLQKYITRFKIEKAENQLTFIEGRFLEKKKEFEKAQERLARYRDQNRNISGAMAGTEVERLQGEYSIALNVYNELAKQLEQAKIKVKEETPVFSVLKPAVVPNERSKPKKAMILAVWIFLGGITGVGIIFGKDYISELKQKWIETKR
jgi:LPS O-antigen subunit length determinant protein (WzzB/FepE family)